jgi:hypothetical protein
LKFRSGQVTSRHVRSDQIRSGHVTSRQVRSGQVRSGQVTSRHVTSRHVRSGQVSVPLQGAVRPCRWWRGLSNRSDARGDAGGSFALLAGSPMPARVERTGEKQKTARPSGSTTKVVARELVNPGEIRATVLVERGPTVIHRNRGSNLNNPCERGRGTCEDSRPGGLP